MAAQAKTGSRLLRASFAAVFAVVVVGVIFSVIQRYRGAPQPPSEPADGVTTETPGQSEALEKQAASDELLDMIKLPSSDRDLALLEDISAEVQRLRRRERGVGMTPVEIEQAETIDLWRTTIDEFSGRLLLLYSPVDPERPVRYMLRRCDELAEFVRRPDALDVAIDEYREILAVLHDPNRLSEQFGEVYGLEARGPLGLSGITSVMYTLDRLLASDEMIDRSIGRADELLRIYMERDRIMKAVMETGTAPWNDGSRRQLSYAAQRIADRMAPDLTQGWQRRVIEPGQRRWTLEEIWDLIEREFIDR